MKIVFMITEKKRLKKNVAVDIIVKDKDIVHFQIIKKKRNGMKELKIWQILLKMIVILCQDLIAIYKIV